MFRSRNYSACYGFFQRSRQVNKNERSRSFEKFSNTSTASTASISPRTTSLASRTNTSTAFRSQDKAETVTYNPLSMHPPLDVNQPPQLAAAFANEPILRGVALEEENERSQSRISVEKLQHYQFHGESQDNDDFGQEIQSVSMTPENMTPRAEPFIPFSPEDYDKFRRSPFVAEGGTGGELDYHYFEGEPLSPPQHTADIQQKSELDKTLREETWYPVKIIDRRRGTKF